MACSCEQNHDPSVDPESTPDDIANPIDFEFGGYEVYGTNTSLDATKFFWGDLIEDATANLVKVKSERAGIVVIFVLQTVSTDSIVDVSQLTAGKFVFGAFKPDTIFQVEDNVAAPDRVGEITINGTVVVIDAPTIITSRRGLLPLTTVDAAENLMSIESETDKGESVASSLFQQLGIEDKHDIAKITHLFIESAQTVVLDGRDVIEVYALVKSAFTAETAMLLLALFAEDYRLGQVDAVPCRPGVQTGQVFSVWRLYHPITGERRTITHRVDMRKIDDVHHRWRSRQHTPEFVDPDKWTAEVCSKCRRACAKAFVECLTVSQGLTGPEAAQKYKLCVESARTCYEACIC